MHRNVLLAILTGATIVLAMPAIAATLTCMPTTLCIDDACQAGHDDRLAIRLRDWTLAHPVLESDYGKVRMERGKGDEPMQWTGMNAEGRSETLTFWPATMQFVHVVTMELTSVISAITASGHCEVTK